MDGSITRGRPADIERHKERMMALRAIAALRAAAAHGRRGLAAAARGGADAAVVGPGPAPDGATIGTEYEQAAGKERVEYLSGLAGRSAFLMDPLCVDHYGTLADPILVESAVGRRLVGCTGFPKYSHEAVFFFAGDEGELDGGAARCNDCGQAFRIKPVA